ncbi:hypothetical protein OnM2_058025 [Erysiphe neolycopersici]|uniref:Uncharacterized protein n=1 Tax=Erysiphe neolycopersici TaxID=212602 RepID=A0A420HQJ4_9PEZI|nr:hypothetical protein OnM2_058025 [Erysiphe neolycopersici]
MAFDWLDFALRLISLASLNSKLLEQPTQAQRTDRLDIETSIFNYFQYQIAYDEGNDEQLLALYKYILQVHKIF